MSSLQVLSFPVVKEVSNLLQVECTENIYTTHLKKKKKKVNTTHNFKLPRGTGELYEL